MADAEQVDAGPAGSAPSDDRADPATLATLRPDATEAPEERSADASDLAGVSDGEPAASVRGVPTWTFPIPSSPPAAGSALPLFPPPPPAPPPAGASRTAPTTSLQILTVPSLGPAGKRRRPAVVGLLSVITLGAYTLAWHAAVNREMSDFDARLEVRPRLSTLAVAIDWAMGLLCTLAGAALIAAHVLKVGPALIPFASGPSVLGATVAWHYVMLGGLVAVPYLVLLLPTSVVAVVMTLERLRLVQERVGVRPDRQLSPVRRACLLLLPVIGGIWHVAWVQSCLNRVWQATPPLAPPPGPRRG
jgi:hypothetical protein